ncbi:MAG: Asp-tRNA(Asn)/Glu-tRNA(Gln) amidotransferase subunit GatC [Candidatus Riflebacteria bacterium]|nr:Asp-tRNA(Asn)/Glu-tRNA(Gln) amidotransferase subunit GatC [Candidatus Riflebacteria bacterium]
MADVKPQRPPPDRALVEYLCRLSRLGLSEDEIPSYVADLQQIVGYVERLEQLALDGVEPTSHALDLASVTRPDDPAPSEPRDRVLANAPCRTADSFKVPKVV